MPQEQTVTALCQYLFTTLEHDLTLGGKTIPAGTVVLMLPQTTAACVRVPGETSLKDAWDSLSKTGHEHESYALTLAGFQEQLTRYLNRLTSLEAWAVNQGYTLPQTD